MIKIQWLASIWRQNDQNIQNKAKLQKWSKSNDLHRFDVKTIKTFKTKLNYKCDQNPMTCIDFTSKRSKMLSYVAKHAKLQNRSNYNKLHRLDVKTIKTKLNYKCDQNPMTCIDLTSKRSKMLSYVAKHSKQRKTTKQNKLQLIASIGCQNDRNKAKLQKWSKSNDLHRFDVKTIKNVELSRKTFKTTQNYKSDQNPMTWIDLMSKHSKQSKSTKPIKLQLIASIGCQNDQNKAKLQKWSKSNDFHRFDVKTIKNVELRRKTFKTTLNYKSDQNPINWIDLMSKHSKQSKTIKPIKLQWIASIGCQNDQTCWVTSQNIQNNAKLQIWSKSNDLNRFDARTF